MKEEIYRKASAYGVGIPIKKYYTYFVPVFLICGLLMLASGIWLLVKSVPDYQNRSSAQQYFTTYYMQCKGCSDGARARTMLEVHYALEDSLDYIWQGGIYICTSFIFLFVCWLYSLTKLYVCSNGLLLIDGKEANAIRWNDVVEVRKEKKGRFAIFVLEKKDQEQFCTPSGIIGKSLQIAIEQGTSEFVTTANV
ncbi:hypothetical protein [Dictyobacter formicarum]|uniref:YcxB-like protein domain-containing protein n=1 Tax=Dictyobacter formicarum TaxID=2778368 RepID=A0ABQ3VDS2_9CHLR|nr:hypothetical protein [Dictyobacter formicarum]GHO83940.1 hypothetical protein KSZ_19460 [Dictyobacter formicarum]